LTDWWLAKPRWANTPNWDIASTATIEGREGLVLIEAKAHDHEISAEDKCSAGNAANLARIEQALSDANAGLGPAGSGWNLGASKAYQLCNRFAWAWKLASLGFLAADDMGKDGAPFASRGAWETFVRSHGLGFVPDDAWGELREVGAGSLRAIIRAADLGLAANGQNLTLTYS